MKKKFAIALVAVALVVGCVVGGTLAWLTVDTDPVTNTFTVGDITITLDESTTGDVDGKYKIVPGGKSDKDPTITVEAGSEKCYVYALVENTVKLNDTVVATPNIGDVWVEVSEFEDADATLYRYNAIVEASTDTELPVFTEVTYSDTITKDDIFTLNDTTIIVTAYAHQSENTTVDDANANAITWATGELAATN